MDDLNTSLRRARKGIKPPEDALERLLDRRRRKQRGGRIASIAVAFLVVAGGVTGAVIAFSGSSRHHAPARVSSGGDQKQLVAGPGQYYYSNTEMYSGRSADAGAASGVEGPSTIELWFGPDASGRAVYRDKDETYGPGEMPLEDLSNLSSDPDTLRSQLTDRAMPGGASPNPIATTAPGRSQEDTSLLRTFQDLFDGSEQFTPPAVRAAMFSVAQGVTGVETLTGVSDPVERPAVELRWIVQYEGPPSYVAWYFDPDTKQLMAETWTQEGKLFEARIVTRAGITDSTQQAPSGDELFFPTPRKAFTP
jgi:hypothetical protein